MTQPSIATIRTPCLLLDEGKMQRNIDRMAERARSLGVGLRPHLKTCKSIEIADRMVPRLKGPATVSTLAEAEEFAASGFNDLLYAVGIAPQKLDRVTAIRASGCDLAIILDSLEQAEAVAAASRASDDPIPVLIEIDSDGHRAGVRPDDAQLVGIGKELDQGGAELHGVMTHAGGSYDAAGADRHAEWAERERDAAVAAAERLRKAGLPCPVVSVGSTPTAMGARDLTGVTELRAGVYVFQDLVMAGIGVCTLDEIAISVLATVVGARPDRGQVFVDAGWMALSRDRGTRNQDVDQGYGLVCREDGRPFDDLIIAGANQEHGVIEVRPASDALMPDLPIGTRIRILPNHACATAAQHAEYRVLDGGTSVVETWPRFGGW